jgi:hypothetical protein
MKKLALLSLLAILPAFSASAAYDDSWYQADFWSGEYPNGVAVMEEGVSLMGRATMDPQAATDVACELPKFAVYHPWNERRAEYRTAAKIVPMTATANFRLTEDDREAKVHKGDVVEYLVYGAEGTALVRFQGQEWVIGQEEMEKLSYDEKLMIPQEEWFKVPCTNGGEAWLFLNELATSNDDGEFVYAPGLGSWWKGFREYGKVTDLTPEDLEEGEGK